MMTTVELPLASPEIVVLDATGLAALEIDPGLGAIWGYTSRGAEAVRASLGRAMQTPGGEVFAAVTGGAILGYVVIGPAPIDQPWGRLRGSRVLEVVVEVARGHRGHGLAEAMFRRAFSRPEVESRIYVANAYIWCWDIETAGVNAGEYAARLLRLFERFGFRPEWTTEPNIALEPVNFLAVRIGRLVSADLIRRFRQAERGEAVA